MHCPKNNLNLRLKTSLSRLEHDATVIGVYRNSVSRL